VDSEVLEVIFFQGRFKTQECNYNKLHNIMVSSDSNDDIFASRPYSLVLVNCNANQKLKLNLRAGK